MLRPERLRDVLALLPREDDAAKVGVHAVVLVEDARVLRKRLDGAPEDGPGLAVDGVAVGDGACVRAGFVDGGVWMRVSVCRVMGDRVRD